ncbi:MAG: ROK family protein, partial [Candidatus Diapherotrites archaeon]|nr:ROK family protein [Candidatus Diapherotrites archaeon]
SAGIRGSLEAMANGASVVLRARKAGLRVSDAAVVSVLGAEKNPKAVRALVETGFCAGIGIANLVNTLHLDSVVLAGGLSRSKILSESAKKTALKRLYPSFEKGLSVRASGLEMGACVGAALLAFER